MLTFNMVQIYDVNLEGWLQVYLEMVVWGIRAFDKGAAGMAQRGLHWPAEKGAGCLHSSFVIVGHSMIATKVGVQFC